MFINAGMLAEMLESIANLLNHLEVRTNTMEKQSLLMRGRWWRCWKVLKPFNINSKYEHIPWKRNVY